MPRAVLHVGMPRTGTTSIQAVLSRLRPAMAARGVLYPDLTPRSAPRPHLSHQHLGEALDGRRPARERAELLAALEAQLRAAGPEVVILSYEALALIHPWRAAPRRLRALFDRLGYATEVVATLKPQAAQVNSTYTWRCQFLREGRPFAQFAAAEAGSRHLDYAALLRPWRAAAEGRLRAVPVRDRRSDAPLLARFLAELGLEAVLDGLVTPGDLVRRENASPGPLVVEALRRLRREGAPAGLRGARPDVTRAAEAFARDRGWDAVPFQGMDAALRARIAARHAAANDALAQQVWGEGWAARMGPEAARPVNDLSAAPAEPSAEAAVAAIMAAVRAQFGLAPLGGARLALRAVGEAALRVVR